MPAEFEDVFGRRLATLAKNGNTKIVNNIIVVVCNCYLKKLRTELILFFLYTHVTEIHFDNIS